MATRQALSASTAEGATLEDIAHSVVAPAQPRVVASK